MYVRQVIDQGSHRSGKSQEKMDFLKSQEKVRKFQIWSGNFQIFWKVRKKSGNFMEGGRKCDHRMIAVSNIYHIKIYQKLEIWKYTNIFRKSFKVLFDKKICLKKAWDCRIQHFQCACSSPPHTMFPCALEPWCLYMSLWCAWYRTGPHFYSWAVILLIIKCSSPPLNFHAFYL